MPYYCAASATSAAPTPTLSAKISAISAEIHLTPIEYKLLALLARHAGKVLTHRHLLKEVWGPGHAEQTHYLRVRMAELRRKIEANPSQPRWLLTEPGVGYRLRVSEPDGPGP